METITNRSLKSNENYYCLHLIVLLGLTESKGNQLPMTQKNNFLNEIYFLLEFHKRSKSYQNEKIFI